MFELITDFVFMGFPLLSFAFCFGFFRRVVVLPVHMRKRKDRLKPATTPQFFSETERQEFPDLCWDMPWCCFLTENKPAAVLNARLVRWQQKTRPSHLPSPGWPPSGAGQCQRRLWAKAQSRQAGAR
jgi:hypothetical protein